MAVLTTNQRKKLWDLFMSKGHCPGSVLKTDLLAAVDALDDWIDTNAAAINTALPQPFRGQASPEQKAILLAYIALERAGVL